MAAAVVALYVLARRFSHPDDVDAFKPPPDEPASEKPRFGSEAEAEERAVRQRSAGDTTIQNYGFRSVNLATGPEDPEDFFDELIVYFYAAGTGHTWEATYTVCTPKGIARYMRDKGYTSLLASGYVIVERYDIDAILETILEPVEDIGDYEEPDQLEPDSVRPR